MQERFDVWKRNVIDEFQNLSTEEIKKIIKQRSIPISILVENWQGDFNISSCLRNSNAIGAECFYYLGKKRFDRRGALGCYHYTDIVFLETIEDLLKLKQNHTLIAAENVGNFFYLDEFNWKTDKKPLVIFGEEGIGITKQVIEICDFVVAIKQRGSIRSLNASVASGIFLYDFASKFEK